MTQLCALVAENDPALLSLVTRELRNLGLAVVEAIDGGSAWDLAQQHRPDLVILDVMLPGMGGLDVCRRIKGDAADGRVFARTGVIMLTENDGFISPVYSADAWLKIPFDGGELVDRARATLARYGKSLSAGQ